MMDPLVELPVEKWPILQEKLKKLWPINVPGYYTLELNLRNPQIRDAFDCKVYCPYGDMDNGFVATNFKPPDAYDCILFSLSEDTSKLEEAMVNTQVIDWNRKVCMDLVTSVTLQTLNRIRPIIGFSYYEVRRAYTYFYDRTLKPFPDLSCPTDSYVSNIKIDHLQRVNDVWPYKYNGSYSYFAALASNGLSYGLYWKDELLAWIFLNEYNFLCHLYCEVDHRRRGLAEYILKYVVNDQLRKGNDLYGYVIEGNERAMKLFEKSGFAMVDFGAYLFVSK